MPLATKWAPISKTPCRLAVPLIKTSKIADFLQTIFFRLFLGLAGVILCFTRCWPYFVAGHNYWRPRKAKCSLVVGENPYFSAVGAVWHTWPYSQEEGLTHTCSPGRLQGHLWVIPTIGSCFYGPLRLFPVFVSGLLLQTQSKPPQNTVF